MGNENGAPTNSSLGKTRILDSLNPEHLPLLDQWSEKSPQDLQSAELKCHIVPNPPETTLLDLLSSSHSLNLQLLPT